VCKEFIQASPSCHAGGWARFTGECNEARSELNRCLQSDVSISKYKYYLHPDCLTSIRVQT
ncbi:hypothetical protein FIBSPDRAFT_826261, partial [Athelia psychrophila]